MQHSGGISRSKRENLLESREGGLKLDEVPKHVLVSFLSQYSCGILVEVLFYHMGAAVDQRPGPGL
jgi:hypothetical protein